MQEHANGHFHAARGFQHMVEKHMERDRMHRRQCQLLIVSIRHGGDYVRYCVYA